MPVNWYWPVIMAMLLVAGVVWGWGGIQYSEDGDETAMRPVDLPPGPGDSGQQGGEGQAPAQGQAPGKGQPQAPAQGQGPESLGQRGGGAGTGRAGTKKTRTGRGGGPGEPRTSRRSHVES